MQNDGLASALSDPTFAATIRQHGQFDGDRDSERLTLHDVLQPHRLHRMKRLEMYISATTSHHLCYYWPRFRIDGLDCG